ncbi:E3 ubiquitin-protein ligase AMFR-like [Contarinia nasturtii]|uniref:E3 ubiquitin-protein ligase AMFR-like n=1 Tax=Contarinia nasturtii TaxID=265458 RepID=UPI0012D38FE8|nr:E3 ubiquitin-protein ligase AMFR-like [Contarinia nasturtii]
MPIVLLDRLRLPNLRLYTSISVVVVSCSLYYAISSTSDPFWRLDNNTTASDSFFSLNTESNQVVDHVVNGLDLGSVLSDKKEADGSILTGWNGNVEHHTQQQPHQQQHVVNQIFSQFTADQRKLFNDTRTIGNKFKDVVSFMVQEPICVWTVINMAYCCLILLGKSIQKLVFGELRISEQQHLKDKFWNFVFYKFIFVFGVVNVQFLHEVVLWVSWFSILGFLHLISQLCKERFEYLSFSPTTPGWSHLRLVALLSTILVLSGFMFIVCVGVGFFGGLNTFAFMAAECVMLIIRTLHVLIRYGIFLYDMRQSTVSSEGVSWDKRGPVAYYVELGFEVSTLVIDLLHHIHMLIWSNIFLSMASLVIVMQLRYLIHEIQRKVKKHRNYLWVLNHMEKTYPLATAEDLSNNSDNCAICWEKMDTARKLPCSHLFHNSCLQSWLEQDTSCPTCRLGLSVQNFANIPDIERIIDEQENTTRANNHFFHFNGSRYVSWLPNFSVEVTPINNVLRTNPVVPSNGMTSQLHNMARQVQQMFPRYPLSTIISDLGLSRSMEVTIDNILEGRLLVPGGRFDFDDDNPFNEFTTTSNEQHTDELSRHSSENDSNSSNSNNNSTTNSISSTNSSLNMADIGYEIEQSTNIFGNHNDLLRDESANEELSLGDRFSKSHSEREKILQQRKESMLALARKRYFEKNKTELSAEQSSRNESMIV